MKKLKRYKSPGIDQIPAELVTEGGRKNILRTRNLLILFGKSRNCLRNGRSQSLYLAIRWMIEQTEVIKDAYHFCQQNFIRHPAVNVNSTQRKLFVLITVDFDATGQLLILYAAFVKYLRKKWEYNEAVHQLFIDFKKAYDSVRREVLYNILM